MVSLIQVWRALPALPVHEDSTKSQIKVVLNGSQVLPRHLEQKVQQAWDKRQGVLVDNLVPFLIGESASYDGAMPYTLHATERGFSYAQAFGRNEQFASLVKPYVQHKLAALATHCHVITSDGDVIFGVKKNQNDEVTGFGGFPKMQDVRVTSGDNSYMDMYRATCRTIEKEVPEIVDTINAVDCAGLVYVDGIGIRGANLALAVRVRRKTSDALHQFQESTQFHRGAEAVAFTPEALSHYFRKIHANRRRISPCMLGCTYAVVNALHGKEDAEKILGAIRTIGYTFSTKDELGYLLETF